MELRGPSRRPHPEILNRAFKVASTPPTGPVYLSLPSNLLGESISVQNPDVERSRIVSRMAGDPDALKDAAKLLAQAKRPLIVAGSGVAKAGAIEELVKLAELVAVPVVDGAALFISEFSDDASLQFSDRGTATHFQSSCMGRAGSDFCHRLPVDPRVPLHSRTRDQTRNPLRSYRGRPWEIGKVFPVDLGIVADPKSALRSLVEIFPMFSEQSNGSRKTERIACLQKAKAQTKAELESRIKAGWDATPINAARLMRTMDKLIDQDALIVNESPTSKDILMSNFQFTSARSYFSNSSAGHLGWGLGAAIGAALASPKRRVVACLGDGSAMFGIQGLWTLAKYRVPLLVIVFNNRAYMAVKNQFRGPEERIRIAAEMGAELVGPEINFSRLAETFGIFGQRVEQPEAIEPALKRALEQSGPAVLNIVINQNTRKD